MSPRVHRAGARDHVISSTMRTHPILISAVFLGCTPTQPVVNNPAGAAANEAAASSAAAKDASASTPKTPEAGLTTFTRYEGYLSPSQQPGEESEASKPLEKLTGLEPSAPSTPREQRKSKGYGLIRFNKNLSRAYVDVQVEGVNPEDIVMFHVHCGPPGVLGPILVDFGTLGDLKKSFPNGHFMAELSNKNITYVKDMPGLKPALPESCPAELGFLPTQTMTIAGMEYLARKGVLYFNLHTKAHTFYGEMRGQIYPAKD